jgi:hypothetical protein
MSYNFQASMAESTVSVSSTSRGLFGGLLAGAVEGFLGVEAAVQAGPRAEVGESCCCCDSLRGFVIVVVVFVVVVVVAVSGPL